MALIAKRGNGAKARAFRSAEDAIDNLALNQATQKGNVLGGVQQVQEAAAGIEQLGRGLAGGHGGTFRRRFLRENLVPAEKFSDYLHIELEHETEVGHLLTGLDHVADHW